jgi:cytochrome c biogenesis protein CcmG/thiol:disulfide interchange protein DsbE
MTFKWLRWVGLAIALGTVVFAVVLASRFGSDPGLVDSPLIGQPAPEFELTTLDGTDKVALNDLEGDIVVINFFASWCLQCRAEHADLVATSDAFGEDDVTFVQIGDLVATSDAFGEDDVTFVQIGYQESPSDSLKYLEEAGTSKWTKYLADPGSRTAIAYGVFGIPETFFIDPEGTVVGKIIGEADALTLGATIDAIKRGEQPGQSVTGDTQQSPDA